MRENWVSAASAYRENWVSDTEFQLRQTGCLTPSFSKLDVCD